MRFVIFGMEVPLTTPIVLLLTLCLMFVITSLSVLLANRLVWTLIALGVGSTILAIIFFIFGARYAGGFELSVGAGLVSVLFVIGTSLTKSTRRVKE